MPASKFVFIPHSCFGYYDPKFEECSRKCRMADACRRATMSDRYEEVRGIYKYTRRQIQELADEWSDPPGEPEGPSGS